MFWKSVEKCFYVFIMMSYSHTCGLELDIFVLGYGHSNIFVQWSPIQKITRVPLLRRPLFVCDIISYWRNYSSWIHQVSGYKHKIFSLSLLVSFMNYLHLTNQDFPTQKPHRSYVGSSYLCCHNYNPFMVGWSSIPHFHYEKCFLSGFAIRHITLHNCWFWTCGMTLQRPSLCHPETVYCTS